MNTTRYRNFCNNCNSTNITFLPISNCGCNDNNNPNPSIPGIPSGGTDGDILVKNGNSWIWKSKLSGNSIEDETININHLSEEVINLIDNSFVYNDTVGF